tara:strand:+ start:291 stop:899 length:609 start_codon:yes stop_codon:yes gene_type:complete
MKNSLLLLLFVGSLVYGQESIGTYEVLGKELSVQATNPDEKGSYDLYVDGYSLDTSHETAGLLIRYKKIDDFKLSLEKAAQKYAEWVLVAKENNIKELDKVIEVSSPKVTGYFLYYKEWKFDYLVNLKYRFLISENNGVAEYGMIITTGEMESSDNEFMTLDNVAYPFYSIDEINNFISLLDKQLVLDKFNSKDNKEDLFKN